MTSAGRSDCSTRPSASLPGGGAKLHHVWHDRDIKRSVYKELWLQGDVIGVNNVTLWHGEDLLHTQPVYVVVRSQVMNNIFTMVMITMVLLNTINMGAQLDLDIIVKVFKKPVGPLVGFASQFLFMPLFSFLVGWLVTEDTLFRQVFLWPSTRLLQPSQTGPLCPWLLSWRHRL